ncbi:MULTISPECIES: DUF6176 family protein [unclassified Brevibacterium]|uniref:DUF6176 family protein n=1 Tax=unclassified Brevibacterium TaxID=2614124 RepID=UPI001F104D2D|nr:DUF6176 family protein [Brevibacterium sp. S22]
MSNDAQAFQMPFTPTPRDFSGFPMPPSVPKGMRLELSRSRIRPGQEDTFDEWMGMLNSRPDELQESLPAERQVFEATFRHTEADGSTWIYHLSLMGEDGRGNDESIPIDAAHVAFSKKAKEPGWEELEPRFMLTPTPLLESMKRYAEFGQDND